MFVCLFLPPLLKKTKKEKHIVYFRNHQDKSYLMKQLRIIIYLFVCFYPPPKKTKKERPIVYFWNHQDKSYFIKLLRIFVCFYPPLPPPKKTKKRKTYCIFSESSGQILFNETTQNVCLFVFTPPAPSPQEKN